MTAPALAPPLQRGVVILSDSMPGIASPDVYFSREYGFADAIRVNGQWVTLHAYDGRWQLPLVLRPIPEGGVDGVSPYGYAGVYADLSLSKEDVSRAWRDTLSVLRDVGVVSVVLRHSPLVAQAPRLADQVTVVSGHATRLVELRSKEEAWTALAGRARTAIRKATASGMVAAIGHATHAGLAAGSPFRILYERTMDRVGAATEYYFDDAYYSTLLAGLGRDLLLVTVALPDSRCVSAALLMRHGGTLHYHLSGSDPEGARAGANNLLLWTAIEMACEERLSQVHLGGGVHGNDALYQFKRSFGGRDVEYELSGLVVDADAYARLVAAHAAVHGASAQHSTTASFFPAYRAVP